MGDSQAYAQAMKNWKNGRLTNQNQNTLVMNIYKKIAQNYGRNINPKANANFIKYIKLNKGKTIRFDININQKVKPAIFRTRSGRLSEYINKKLYNNKTTIRQSNIVPTAAAKTNTQKILNQIMNHYQGQINFIQDRKNFIRRVYNSPTITEKFAQNMLNNLKHPSPQ